MTDSIMMIAAADPVPMFSRSNSVCITNRLGATRARAAKPRWRPAFAARDRRPAAPAMPCRDRA
jgi:hypothetical protein